MKRRILRWCIVCFLAFLAAAASTRAQTLGEVLDATNLVWTTSGVPWFPDMRNGKALASCGACQDSESSILETTIVGPGTLYFDWFTSSEQDADALSFWIGTNELARISGETSEFDRTVELPAGTNALSWIYH